MITKHRLLQLNLPEASFNFLDKIQDLTSSGNKQSAVALSLQITETILDAIASGGSVILKVGDYEEALIVPIDPKKIQKPVS